MRLTRKQAEQLRTDLNHSPREFGYPQPSWTANCLSRHLRSHYQVDYAIRHCRRLIRWAVASTSGGSVNVQPAEQPVSSTNPRTWCGFSEDYRHKKALHTIRQLSLAGLPLKHFSENLFEQLTAATQSGEAMQMIGLDDPRHLKFVFRDQETMEWTATHLPELELVNSDDTALSGMVIGYSQLRWIEDPVLPTSRFMGSHFHKSPAYNEVWKYHRVHSGVMNFFRDNHRYIGLGPIWKSRTERPFTAEDLKFLERAVPLITHGLVAAEALSRQDCTIEATEPTGRPVGVVTANLDGHVLAMDRTARYLFSQPAVLDGRPMDAFATSKLKEGLRYVSSVIRQAFGAFHFEAEAPAELPAARVWWHSTGAVLLLKAVLSERLSGSPLVTILVEERQLAGMQQKRLALKHGMSPRESEVFELAKAGVARKEIAYQLSLSVNTVRTYIKQIGMKGLTLSADLHE